LGVCVFHPKSRTNTDANVYAIEHADIHADRHRYTHSNTHKYAYVYIYLYTYAYGHPYTHAFIDAKPYFHAVADKHRDADTNSFIDFDIFTNT
jgi:hypothetical protein